MGYKIINLENNSEFFNTRENYKKFRVTEYDKNKMLSHHNKEKNEYLIPNSILKADVIINLPKLKSHRLAGMTCSLKNLVGINGCKDWLPHHQAGSEKRENGDEYLYKSPRKLIMRQLKERENSTNNKIYFFLLQTINSLVYRTRYIIPFKDPYFNGAWYGNNTISKTIIDLNKIIFYADKNGKMQNKKQRKMFIAVDAIIAGEKEGPLKPSPKKSKTIIMGKNPVAIDLVCSQIMNFDYQKIPTIQCALNSKKYKLFNDNPKNIKIIDDKCKNFNQIDDIFGCHFVPSSGWINHIEK